MSMNLGDVNLKMRGIVTDGPPTEEQLRADAEKALAEEQARAETKPVEPVDEDDEFDDEEDDEEDDEDDEEKAKT
jgi:hypothetical protein